MKKTIAILMLLAFTAVGAFAQGIDMSAGGGALFDLSGRNGIKAEIPFLGDFYTGARYTSFGGFLFFDATYGEFDVNFTYGILKPVEDPEPDGFDEENGSALALGFTLLGKYPIALGTGLTVFPMAGIDYNLTMSVKRDDGTGSKKKVDDIEGADMSSMDFSQFGFLVGGGLDYNLTEALYIRGELLFHLRLASKAMKDMRDNMNDGAEEEGFDLGAKATLGMGPRIKVGVGYRF